MEPDSSPLAPAWPTLDRYLSGHASPGEHAEVSRWLEACPDERPALEALAMVVRGTHRRDVAESVPSAAEVSVRVEAMLRGSAQARHAREADVHMIRSQSYPHKRLGRYAPTHVRTLAATCALAGIVAAAGVFGWHAFQSHIALHITEYVTQSGERQTITLSDNSTIVLAPETRVRVVQHGNGARDIDLTGQAFFTITHSETSPVTVHTGKIQTRVLGTSFDVRKYAADSVAHIAVVTGKVAVHAGTANLTLTAGHAGVATDSTTNPSSANPQDIAKWTDGRLVFRNTPVSTVLASASRWCGYQFRLADSTIADQRVTTVLVVGKPDDTMRALRELLDVTMTVDGRTVTLHPARPGRQVKSAPLPSDRKVVYNASEKGI